MSTSSKGDNIAKSIVIWNELVMSDYIREEEVLSISVEGARPDEHNAKIVLKVNADAYDQQLGRVANKAWSAVLVIDPSMEYSKHSVAKCIVAKAFDDPRVVYSNKYLTSNGTIQYVKNTAHEVHKHADVARVFNSTITQAMSGISQAFQAPSVHIDSTTGQMMKKLPNGQYEPYIANTATSSSARPKPFYFQSRRDNSHRAVWDGENMRVDCKCKTYCHMRYEWVGTHPDMALLFDTDGKQISMSLPIALGITDVTFTVEFDDDMFYISDNGTVGVDMSLTQNDPIKNIVHAFENTIAATDRFELFFTSIRDKKLHMEACLHPAHKRNILSLSRIPFDAPVETVNAAALGMAYHSMMSGRCFMCANDSLRKPTDFYDDIPDF